MRWIACIVMMLLAVGWFLTTIAPGDAADSRLTTWRRTEQGWQRRDQWPMPRVSQRPPVHPLVVGGLGVLAVALALVASIDQKNTPKTLPVAKPGKTEAPEETAAASGLLPHAGDGGVAASIQVDRSGLRR